MVTFAELLDLDVGAMETFATRWNSIHRKVQEAREEFYEDVTKKLREDNWQGKGGKQAEEHCDRLQTSLEAFEQQVRALGRFVDRQADAAIGKGGTGGLQALQERALEALEKARENGITITGNGDLDWSYFYDPDAPGAKEKKEAHDRAVKHLEKEVKSILEKANKIDDELSYNLESRLGTPRNFDTESREHGALNPDPGDRIMHNKMRTIAGILAIKKGWPTAAGLLEHWLGGSGKPVEVEPEKMMKDIPAFQKDVDKTLESDVKNRPDGKFTTEWQKSAPKLEDGDSSQEWYYALNNFQYRLVGEKQGDEVVYHVEMQKRYDWGTPSEGKRTVDSGYPAPFDMSVEQADAARLHSVGMAKDFDVKGRSDEMEATL